jgi:hypothetical protein
MKTHKLRCTVEYIKMQGESPCDSLGVIAGRTQVTCVFRCHDPQLSEKEQQLAMAKIIAGALETQLNKDSR